jgi:hypothetical protein
MSLLNRKSVLVLATLIAQAMITAQASAAEVNESRFNYDAINNEQKAGQLGVGLEVGALSGATFEYWTASQDTVNVNITSVQGNLGLGATHNWMFRDAFRGTGRYGSYFVPYVGAGALAAFGTQNDYFTNNTQNFALAATVPLGVEFLPLAQRFSVFLELAPTIEVVPAVAGVILSDLGARFYF